MDFEVPYWEWDGDHPLVPTVDSLYEFNSEHLSTMLFCLIHNIPQWLVGHTGTGKTTHVLQVLARLNWPVCRANFDSELTRMEVIGKETLVSDGKTTVTKFSETILPIAMRHGYVFLGDEWDCIRPDVAYVFQPVLEGGDLVIMEDSARIIQRHPMFRVIATGNTKGQGDDSGIYNGTRPQSGASMDRFPVMIEFEYMEKSEVKSILTKKFTKAPNNVVNDLTNFAYEYWVAFSKAEITTPLTLRGLENILSMYTFFKSAKHDEKQALKMAVRNTCLSKAGTTEASVINGLTDRTVVSGGVR
jgi:cobaltochelatase CobS